MTGQKDKTSDRTLHIIFLRHSLTQGNLEGRYIGTTDEPLCPEGTALLAGKKLPAAEKIYTSPLKRCVQTAALVWPDGEAETVDGLSECDFGDFENKNYKELDGNADYQAWIDSQGTLPFPGGESHEAFKDRCCAAFAWIVEQAFGKYDTIAVVAHGGTIMSVMERYARPHKSFYEWHVKNAQGYCLRAEAGDGEELILSVENKEE